MWGVWMISVYQELKLVTKIIVICNFLKVSISMWDPMWIHSENNWSELKTVYKYICFLFCSTMHCQIINLCSVLKTRPAWIVLKYNFRLSSLCNTLRYPVTICYNIPVYIQYLTLCQVLYHLLTSCCYN